METLVATVLTVVIFMISSMLLNNIFSNSMRGKSHYITERLHRLKYQYQNKSLKIPYYEDSGDWEFSVVKENEDDIELVVFKAENQKIQKSFTRSIIGD